MTLGPGVSQLVERTAFEFDVRPGDPVRGDLWQPEGAVEDAAIVVCHGFKGFKDWGFFPWAGEELAGRTGFPVAVFNFTGSGVGPDPETFSELDRFARNTFSRELEDLEAVLDRLAVGRAGDAVFSPVSRFGLLGHSRGGATAVLKAAVRRQVRALVTWSAVASTDRYRQEYAPVWEAGETVVIENARTGQKMPLRRNVLDDLRAHPDRLDVTAAAASLRAPYLVVHGAEDESVPFAHAERLAEAAGERAALHAVENAGHTFGAAHPFEGAGPELEEAVEASARHFRRHLAPEDG